MARRNFDEDRNRSRDLGDEFWGTNLESQGLGAYGKAGKADYESMNQWLRDVISPMTVDAEHKQRVFSELRNELGYTDFVFASDQLRDRLKDSAYLTDLRTRGQLYGLNLGTGTYAQDNVFTAREWKAAGRNASPAFLRPGEDINSDMYQAPTTSKNPERPRTIAAMYRIDSPEEDEGTLTVVFRDGTLYNYYEVSMDEWQGFKSEFSKGKYIKNTLDSKNRGPADLSDMPESVREFLVSMMRTAQIVYAGTYVPGHSEFYTKTGKLSRYGPKEVRVRGRASRSQERSRRKRG